MDCNGRANVLRNDDFARWPNQGVWGSGALGVTSNGALSAFFRAGLAVSLDDAAASAATAADPADTDAVAHQGSIGTKGETRDAARRAQCTLQGRRQACRKAACTAAVSPIPPTKQPTCGRGIEPRP